MRHYPYVIVGAGYTGAVLAERIASELGKRVLVMDRRPHIAGNAYDFENAAGILCHRYGPHIFHTNSTPIVEYLSRFTEWTPYEHHVTAEVDGRVIPVPFNLTSLEILFPSPEAARLQNLLTSKFKFGEKVAILKMLGDGDPDLQELARFIYDKIFLGYTTKQWGLRPEELSPSVTARVPIHVSYDNRYFQDVFQKMPSAGYTKMFERIFNHPNITVELNSEFSPAHPHVSYDRLLYTGAIDEFFGYCLGELPYRSLDFEFKTYHQSRHQAVAQMNYPNSNNFTRITEMGHMTGQLGTFTTVAIEYPCAHTRGLNIPYYPIPRDENQALHARYLDFARQEAGNVDFLGRLGDYKYYNMDQATGRALAFFRKLRERVA